ncbi:Protein MIZU-KUSSEI [Heracleum sosnowskyi]|uniref:Protein MIZU-KUSSEI n=1 Tax=Heracleum sosnowskyi TaxID=360622 RepID=A0AAD8HSH8_9APIA|nr:Protein MIZU-KUSSEI [Heracleum sosnowskyi]
MGEPNRISNGSSRSSTSVPPSPPPPPTPGRTLVQPSSSKKHRKRKAFRVFRNVFRTFPIIQPHCNFPTPPGGRLPDYGNIRVCGTLFGFRKGRVSLSIQENPRTLPTFVVELGMQTSALQKEMSAGMVRLALECEKRPEKDKTKLLEEPMWSFFCNGKKNGYGMKREATDADLYVMELLKAVSMGVGVLPSVDPEVEGPDNEMAYLRAHFDRVVGSKDSETLYMLSPDGNNGPELSIFFHQIINAVLHVRFVERIRSSIYNLQTSGSTFAVLGTKIYAFGGTSNDILKDNVRTYDCSSDAMESGPEMLVGRVSAVAEVVNKIIQVVYLLSVLYGLISLLFI